MVDRVEGLVTDLAVDNGPGIWYGSNDFISRLDHPEYVTHLRMLNMRDLRLVETLLSCATDEIKKAIKEKRNA